MLLWTVEGGIFIISVENLSLNSFCNIERRRGRDRKMLGVRRANSTQYFVSHLACKDIQEWGGQKSKICHQFDPKLRIFYDTTVAILFYPYLAMAIAHVPVA